jgi:hypothetical protein
MTDRQTDDQLSPERLPARSAPATEHPGRVAHVKFFDFFHSASSAKIWFQSPGSMSVT